MNYKDFFKGKKVTQLGLGLLGRGLNDALFLLQNGVADLIVTDKKSVEQLTVPVKILREAKLPSSGTNLMLRLGEHRMEDFEGRDFILKGAGIPLDSAFITHAKEKGIPIEMDSSICVKLLPEGVVTIGVTGTRGKSTTTHLIAHILRQAGKNVFVGGNVRDMATLPILKEINKGDFLVLELDSWQLQGFGESRISPHIAVFTTFMSDHMNYYDGDMDKYFDDKANIFKFQNEKDFLIFGEGLDESKLNTKSKKQKACVSNIPTDWQLKIIGEHNKLNIACGVEACRVLGITEDDIRKGVESFGGVEGRLQFVREINGVKIWNDNNATTPEATIAALASLPDHTVLLCGGADKNVSLEVVAKQMNEKCKKIILLKGTGSEKLKPLLKDFVEVDSLEEGVKKAFEFCVAGDNLLFSPMFASFGMFNNEYERNDLFLKIVDNI